MIKFSKKPQNHITDSTEEDENNEKREILIHQGRDMGNQK